MNSTNENSRLMMLISTMILPFSLVLLCLIIWDRHFIKIRKYWAASLFKKLQNFLSSAIHQWCPSGCLCIFWLTSLLGYDQNQRLHVFAAQLQINRVQFFDIFLRKYLLSFCNLETLSLMTRLDNHINEERVQWYYHWNLPIF